MLVMEFVGKKRERNIPVVVVPQQEGVEEAGWHQGILGTSAPFPEAVGAYPEGREEHPYLRGMGKMEDTRTHTQPDHLVEVVVAVAAMGQRQGHHRIHHLEGHNCHSQNSGRRLCRVCHGHHDHGRRPMGGLLRGHGSNRREDGRLDAAAKERDHQSGHAARASGHGQDGHRRNQLRCDGAHHRWQGRLRTVLA